MYMYVCSVKEERQTRTRMHSYFYFVTDNNRCAVICEANTHTHICIL